MSLSDEELREQLDIRVRRSLGDDFEGVIYLKKGPRAYKVASLKTWGPRAGKPATREFKVQTFNRTRRGFSEPERSWSCYDEEIEALQAFLNAHVPGGRYQLVRSGSDIDTLIDHVRSRDLAPSSLVRLLEAASGQAGVVEALASSDDGQLLAEAVGLHRRRQALAELRATVEDPGSNEHAIRRKLLGQTWIFGGRYFEEWHRKRISPEDVVDIPLIRNDGALHIVELKKARIPDLIMEPRSHPTAGYPIHEATLQAANYLRTLDEDTHRNAHEYEINCRRSSATVLIGHANFVEDFSAKDISDALRTYNSLLSRIEVVTYDELITSAERSLEVAGHAPVYESTLGQGGDDPDWLDDDVPF